MSNANVTGGGSTAERGFGEMFGDAKGKLDNLQKNLARIVPRFPGLPVGKFDDLSIGVDLHPTVVPPSPMMAVPHIGKVYDIMGAIMAAINSAISAAAAAGGGQMGAVASVGAALVKGMAPSVKVHNKWIAQAGIGILHLPGYVVHLLPTVSAQSGSEMFMGSSTVLADGAPCSTILHPALSCNAVGFPAPFRKPKTNPRKMLMLPTALLTIITSAGKPVLAGGPPTISLFQLGMKLGMKGLGKLKKLLGKQIKKLSHIAHKAIDKAGLNPKLAKKLKKAACKTFGEPVDAATGSVFHTNVDFELPGPIPLVWERTYYSDAEVHGSMGYNWHHSYNMGIRELDDGIIVFRHGDGRESFFPALSEGETYYDRKEQHKWSYGLNGYLLEDRDGLLYRFNGGKNRQQYQMLSYILTKDGHRVRFYYDGFGNLIEITDSRNIKIKVDSDMYGRITCLSTYLDMKETKLVRYRYDDAGNMVETIDTLDVSKHFYYDGRHQLTRLTNQSGLNFYWEYDGKGRCIHTWGDGGIMEHFVRYEEGVTKETNGLGHTTEYYYDADNLIYKIIDANGGVTRQFYNEHQELELTVNPEGLSVKTEYDDWGNPLRITDENGNHTTCRYDARHNLVKQTSPGGKVFTWAYDAYDRVVKRTTPFDGEYAYAYENGNLKTVTDKNGATYHFAFNKNHALEELTYPKGLKRRWEYDIRGRLTKSTDVKGNTTAYVYDRADNVIRLEEPDGNVHEFKYDASGNLTNAKDKLREVEFVYGPMGILAGRRQNDRYVGFDYDRELQLCGITNEEGDRYAFAFDGLGNVVREAGFDGLTREYVRDGAGRVKRIIRPNGKWTDGDYDGTGNIIRETQYDGRVTHYHYDYDGLLVQAENCRTDTDDFDRNAITFRRDGAGRIVEETQDDLGIKRLFDADGNLTQTTSSLGADIRYSHDDDGNVLQMSSSDWTAEWQRDNTGLELHRRMSGGVELRTTRDSLGRETHRYIGVNNREQTSKRYHWGIGNRLTMTDDLRTGRITRYNYDAFDNLIRSDSDQPDRQTETVYRIPDRIGNLFETKDRSDRRYDRGGRLSEDPNYFHHYDDEGNLIFKEFKKTQGQGYHVWNRKLLKEKYGITSKGSMSGWLYEWDSGGMLTEVTTPYLGKVRFGYDALGRRTFKESKGVRTRWLWDGNVPLHEWTEKKEEPLIDLVTWVFEDGAFIPTARITDRGSESIITDYLGTPTQMYDADGQKTWEAELDIYGRVRTFAGRSLSDCPFRYQGQYFDDETGLGYNRFRYIDYESGNYISQDPIRLAGNNPTLYGYVKDVNSWVDVLGLSPLALPAPITLNPWAANSTIESVIVPKGGIDVNMAMSPGQTKPGRWATTDKIMNIDYARNKLAITPEFKPEISHVQKFHIPEGVRIQKGIVGPQSYKGITYTGGGSQIQILDTKGNKIKPIGKPKKIH